MLEPDTDQIQIEKSKPINYEGTSWISKADFEAIPAAKKGKSHDDLLIDNDLTDLLIGDTLLVYSEPSLKDFHEKLFGDSNY